MYNFENQRYRNCYSLWHLIAIFLILPFISLAQQATLSPYIAPKTILKKSAKAIVEDDYGFLWFGGRNGLHKFDGYAIKSYPQSKDSVLLGTVFALLKDKDGDIWIGSSVGLFQYERASDQILRLFKEQLKNKRGENTKIYSLFEDSKGWIWVGGEDNVFVIKDKAQVNFETIIGLDIEVSRQTQTGVHCIREDHAGRIFAGTSIGLWEIKPDTILNHIPDDFKNSVQHFRIEDMEKGEEDTLWLAGVSGLWCFESERQQFSKIEIAGVSGEFARDVFIDDKKQLWVADAYAIYLRTTTGAFKKHPFSDRSNSTFTAIIYQDQFGNMWIGTGFKILKFEYARDEMLPLYRVQNNMESDDNYFFRAMQDSLGGLWFRMMESGLGYCPSPGKELKILLQPTKLTLTEEIKSFCTDVEGNVWVITLTNGLYRFPKGKETYQHIPLGDSILISNPLAILQDNQNDSLLWISTKFGLCSVNRLTYKEKWFSPSKDVENLLRNNIGGIGQDDNGKIWLKLNGEGIHCEFKAYMAYFDTKREKRKYVLISKPDDGIVLGAFGHVKKVGPRSIWVAMNNGLLMVDTKAETMKLLDPGNGLPVEGVLSIEPVGNGNIWITSPQKLCKFDGKEFECFNPNPGIERFEYDASEKLADGRLLFGGTNGLHIFDPTKMEKDTVPPVVYLRDFQVFNKKWDLGQAHEQVWEIILPFSAKVFTFEFAGLHFIQPENIRYKHILMGLEKEWVESGSDERRATYSNLSPGTYTFKVLAINVDGLETTEKEGLIIRLIISPPWWRTWWAFLLFASAAGAILYGVWRYELQRQLARAEALRLRKLDEVKNRLYTNITHEFRTPLTLINGKATQLQIHAGYLVREGLKQIKRQGLQLLDLINQMLDLAKLESEDLPINKIQGDVIPFLKYLLESFHSLAETKDISLHFDSSPDSLVLDFDPQKLQQIISNLLLNAIKFTEQNGDVYFLIDKYPELLSIKISDTGIGIPEEKLPHIFDRFYQVDDSPTRSSEGTGIGLTLTRELVKLLGGTISVESEVGQGSSFMVLLPISREAGKGTTNEGYEQQVKQEVTLHPPLATEVNLPVIENNNSTLPRLLIIEDNIDVTFYLSSLLQEIYHLITASNGKIGLDLAQRELPDLILCDVMMPEMDGFEVCQKIKEDLQTCHIPIILLTAKADFNSRMEGLEQGADVYLAKPFEEKELKIHLKKLLDNKERLKQFYASNEFISLGIIQSGEKAKYSKKDQVFLQQLLEIVEEHLGNPSFSAESLSQSLHMTYATCLRKIKAITGMTVNEYIRHIRIHRAARQLLEEPEKSITSIALSTGFRSHNYFSREFKKVLDCSPTEYRRNSKI